MTDISQVGDRFSRTGEGRATICETVEDTIHVVQLSLMAGGFQGANAEAVRQRFALVFGSMTAYVPRALHDELWDLIQTGKVTG